MERARITISIKKEVLEKIDRKVDGIKLRNRSHAIESLISETLNLSKIDHAVIMAGGKGALRLIPVIEKTIADLKNYGLEKITIATGYLGEKIKQQIGSGEKFGLIINYIEGGEGTAGSLSLLEKEFKKTFLLVNLDQIVEIDITSLVNFHLNHQPVVTVASRDQKALKGIYILEPEIFSLLPQGFSMLEEDVFPKLIAENKLLMFPLITRN